MLIAGDVAQIPANPSPSQINVVQSAAWFSSNGSNWGNEIATNPTADYDWWTWCTVWHNGVGYGLAYGPNDTDPTNRDGPPLTTIDGSTTRYRCPPSTPRGSKPTRQD